MSHAAPYPAFALPHRELRVTVGELTTDTGAVGHVVFDGEAPPEITGLSAARAAELGFTPKVGSTLVLVAGDDPVTVLLGGGDRAAADATALRNIAAHLARAVPHQEHLALRVPETAIPVADAMAALVEGAALARYVYRIGEDGPEAKLSSLALLAEPGDDAAAGIARGQLTVRATKLARDLGGTPGGMLTATRFGEVALDLGVKAGLEVTVVGEDELVELGCGGLARHQPRQRRAARDDQAGLPAGR